MRIFIGARTLDFFERAVMRLAHKKSNRRKLLNFLGCVLLILALALFCVALLFQEPTFLARYDELMRRLSEFEYAVATLPYRGLVIVAILLVYLAKSVIPIPISAVCVIAGIAFPLPYAVLINIVGFLILSVIKYLWGKHIGGGFVHKLLLKSEEVERVLEKADDKAKGALLVGFRLVPSFPINTISQVYGAMEYNFKWYLLLSAAGFFPKLVSYSIIGRNVFDPFSMAFVMPFVILFTISGVSLFVVNKMIDIYNNRFKKESIKKSGKED